MRWGATSTWSLQRRLPLGVRLQVGTARRIWFRTEPLRGWGAPQVTRDPSAQRTMPPTDRGSRPPRAAGPDCATHHKWEPARETSLPTAVGGDPSACAATTFVAHPCPKGGGRPAVPSKPRFGSSRSPTVDEEGPPSRGSSSAGRRTGHPALGLRRRRPPRPVRGPTALLCERVPLEASEVFAGG